MLTPENYVPLVVAASAADMLCQVYDFVTGRSDLYGSKFVFPLMLFVSGVYLWTR